MEDKRYKEIMKQVGMPDSQSLLTALQQVANEVAQETKKNYANKVLLIVDTCFHAYASSFRGDARVMAMNILLETHNIIK